MPLSARCLNAPDCLAAVKGALVLSDSSPTHLRWRSDYFSPRTVPGDPAGTLNRQTGQYAVSAKGWPLYARHAVWILANDQPLPPNADVTFRDGNVLNVAPDNLMLIDRVQLKRKQISNARQNANRTSRSRGGIPNGYVLESQRGAGYLVSVSLRSNKKALALAVVQTPREASLALLCAAVQWSFLQQLPLAARSELSEQKRQEYAEQARRIFDHTTVIDADDPSSATRLQTLGKPFLTEVTRLIRAQTVEQAAADTAAAQARVSAAPRLAVVPQRPPTLDPAHDPAAALREPEPIPDALLNPKYDPAILASLDELRDLGA